MNQPTLRGQNSKIFISYRREDVRFHTDRLHNDLERHFGKNNIFMDVDAIKGGDPFKTVIENAVGSCEILLAVIGPKWLAISDKNGVRRLDQQNDYVRLEIEAALKRRIRLIPVLMQDAPLPLPEELPESLASLMERQVIKIDENRWDDDVRDLIETIGEDVSPIPPETSQWRWASWLIIASVVLAAGLIISVISLNRTGGNVNNVSTTNSAPSASPAVANETKAQTTRTQNVTVNSVTNTPSSASIVPPPTVASPDPSDGIAAAEAKLTGTYWNYERRGGTKYEIYFMKDGLFRYTTKIGTKPTGTWRLKEPTAIELIFSSNTGARERDDGTIEGDKMTGTGEDPNDLKLPKYRWEATQIK